MTDAIEVPLIELSGAIASVRFGETDMGHVRTLSESFDRLPPILVHRESMAIVDGVHRVQAARVLGRSTIMACFFEGSRGDAYVVAVETNIRHGKPLSGAERRAAAESILKLHPEWSDRMLAETSGISAHAVRALRLRTTVGSGQLNARVGADGRSRPLDPRDRRDYIAKLIHEFPNASLRAIAARANTSIATVSDVRNKLRRGENHIPPSLLAAGATASPPPGPSEPLRCDDPAYRATPELQAFTDWFEARHITSEEAIRLRDELPDDLLDSALDVALDRASFWRRFAAATERRVLPTSIGPGVSQPVLNES